MGFGTLRKARNPRKGFGVPVNVAWGQPGRKGQSTKAAKGFYATLHSFFGRFETNSQPGQGCCITLSVPLKTEQASD